jgi:hypothetical protein
LPTQYSIGKHGIYLYDALSNFGNFNLYYLDDTANSFANAVVSGSNINAYFWRVVEFDGKLFAAAYDTSVNYASVIYSSNLFSTFSSTGVTNFADYFNLVKIGNMLYAGDNWTGYLYDGINWTPFNDACVTSYLRESGDGLFAKRDSVISSSNAFYRLKIKPLNPSCTANFTLIADATTPHHYFALNQSAGFAPISYTWSWGDGSANSIGATPSHTYSTAGNYNICVTIIDGSGCTSMYCDTSAISRSNSNTIITVDVVNQIPLTSNLQFFVMNSTSNISIYPNPTNSTLNIKTTTPTHIKITNMLGGEMLNTKIQTTTTLDISSFAKGIYFVKVGNDVRKVIKE